LWEFNSSQCVTAPPPSGTAPDRPASVIGTGGSNSASLSWTASSGATSYNWRIGGTSISGTTTGTSVSTGEIGFIAAGTYQAFVSASNSFGTSSERASGFFTVTGFA
jgi:predicted phage tail protein